jgi:hypothetical protein
MSDMAFGPPNIRDRLWETLDGATGESIAYVYRVDRHGKILRPFLVRCEATPGLPMMLRDEYGGGLFRVLIQRGREMQFSGTVAVVEGFSSK